MFQIHLIAAELHNVQTYGKSAYHLALAVPVGPAREPKFVVEPLNGSGPALVAEIGPGPVVLAIACLDSTEGAEYAAERLEDLREVLAATRLGQLARNGNGIGSLGLAESLTTEVMGLACHLRVKGGDRHLATAVLRINKPKAGDLPPLRGARVTYNLTVTEAEETTEDPIAETLTGNVEAVVEAVQEIEDPAVLRDLVAAELDSPRPRKGVLSALRERTAEILEDDEPTADFPDGGEGDD